MATMGLCPCFAFFDEGLSVKLSCPSACRLLAASAKGDGKP